MTVNREFAKSPLAGATHGNKEVVSLEEIAFSSIVDLRVEPGTAAFAAVNAALGLILPTVVGQSAKSNPDSLLCNDDVEFMAFCLGPDWWNIVGSGDALSALAPVQAEHHVSVVDISAQRTRVEVYGPKAQEVLAHHWEQDLRDSHFPVGAVSQGVFAKAPVLIHHCCDNCYILYPRASFAAHFWNVLVDSTVEYL